MGIAIQRIMSIKGSIAAFVAALVLSFLSFGYLGLLPYAAARPVLSLFFPPLEDWHGPWVWPVLIGTSIVWSFSFLFAGIINTMLEAQGWSKGHRRLVYLAVLWAGAIGAWLIMLYTNMPPDGVRIPG